jgi:ABC-type branched-subunit amino acid transport system ATPase component
MKTRPLILEAEKISKNFGGLTALHQVDLNVYTGEIVGLIGPNGSGKTTLLNCLCCLESIDEGKILFKGRNITKKRPYQMARMGMARTFQRIRIYQQITVWENLLISRQWRRENFLTLLKPSQKKTRNRARKLLDFLQLSHLKNEPAENLSVGQKRLLELGMALMPDPDLILLDEATSGINPTLINTIKNHIHFLNQEEGKSFIVIEHNIKFISELCHRVYVLDQGQNLAQGKPAEIKNNQAVIEAYFGN